jgi:hypothetical protein
MTVKIRTRNVLTFRIRRLVFSPSEATRINAAENKFKPARRRTIRSEERKGMNR